MSSRRAGEKRIAAEQLSNQPFFWTEFGLESPMQERDCLGWKAHSGGGKGGHVEEEHEVCEKFLVRSK